ncbi:hypothetical protein HYH02_011124 [Chlamydomonas schloesseri]|uniref:Apple domain-containing protein n=1 Tax=Chlamydomonas schloesseri TaxID=2026947 RepID=A0A835T7L3_9CHLO|nr:hypothetical protein HYH02_011124 [Chlamydomonas schloesseri]|eukprot:KAG2437748.1 hypothetical protein HYH02_011124 [Chlamydomonas schloesseri]
MPIKIEGKLIYKTTHAAEVWTLKTSPNTVYRLAAGQPLDAQLLPIPAGNRVSLKCTPVANQPYVCGTVTEAALTMASAPVQTTGVSIKLLVMVMSLTGSCTRSGASVADVTKAFTAPGGYMDYFNDCSYGAMTYDRTAFKVVGTAVSCNAGILRCDEDTIASTAYSAAVKQLGATAVAGYTHYSYVLPTGVRDTCGWVGLAELPGTQTWYSPDNQGIFRKGTVMQEFIHNFGLYHGWRDGVEYADYSTAMGEGNSCPSAPELWRLGWATTVTPGPLNAATLTPAGAFQTFVLPATYLGPDKALLKLTPDWLGAAYTKNVYLALRGASKGDVALLDSFKDQVSVHELNKNIDNVFSARGDPRVSILRTIGEKQAVDLSAYKLLIRAASLIESGTKMVVHVCRYTSSASECKTPTPESPKPSPAPNPSPKPSPAPSPSPKPSPSPSPSPPPKPVPKPSPSPSPSPSPNPSPKPSGGRKRPPPPESEPPPEAYPPPGPEDDNDGGPGPDHSNAPPPSLDPCYDENDSSCYYAYEEDTSTTEVSGFVWGCFEYTDISGQDIKTVSNVASADACKSACASTSGCEVGVYKAGSRQCLLRSKALVSTKAGKNGYDGSVERSCLVAANNGPWQCLKNTVLPGLLLYQPFTVYSAADCAAQCYVDRYCTYFMTTVSGKCLLMDWLFVGRDYQTVSANPNTAVATTCLLIKQAGSYDSAANNYGFRTSALPSSNPGAVQWVQPPSNLYIYMNGDTSSSSGRRRVALERALPLVEQQQQLLPLSDEATEEEEEVVVAAGMQQERQQAAVHRRLRHHQV